MITVGDLRMQLKAFPDDEPLAIQVGGVAAAGCVVESDDEGPILQISWINIEVKLAP